MAKPKVTVFFIVDGQKLELQSVFMSCSVKKHLPKDVTVLAYHRQDYEVSDYTKSILAHNGIKLVPIPRTFSDKLDPWGRSWPIGNKLLAMAEDRDCDISVFVDTDMAFVKPVDFAKELGDAEVMACTADYVLGGLDTPQKWEPVYRHFGLDLPKEREHLLKGRRLLLPPYFNAGLAVFREGPVGRDQVHFGRKWLLNAIEAINSGLFAPEEFSFDQITCPVTIAQIGAKFTYARHALNYNIYAHGYGEGRDVAIPHYHRFAHFLRFRPELAWELFRMIEESLGTEGLKEFIELKREGLAWARPVFQVAREIDQMLAEKGTLLAD